LVLSLLQSQRASANAITRFLKKPVTVITNDISRALVAYGKNDSLDKGVYTLELTRPAGAREVKEFVVVTTTEHQIGRIPDSTKRLASLSKTPIATATHANASVHAQPETTIPTPIPTGRDTPPAQSIPTPVAQQPIPKQAPVTRLERVSPSSSSSAQNELVSTKDLDNMLVAVEAGRDPSHYQSTNPLVRACYARIHDKFTQGCARAVEVADLKETKTRLEERIVALKQEKEKLQKNPKSNAHSIPIRKAKLPTTTKELAREAHRYAKQATELLASGITDYETLINSGTINKVLAAQQVSMLPWEQSGEYVSNKERLDRAKRDLTYYNDQVQSVSDPQRTSIRAIIAGLETAIKDFAEMRNTYEQRRRDIDKQKNRTEHKILLLAYSSVEGSVRIALPFNLEDKRTLPEEVMNFLQTSGAEYTTAKTGDITELLLESREYLKLEDHIQNKQENQRWHTLKYEINIHYQRLLCSATKQADSAIERKTEGEHAIPTRPPRDPTSSDRTDYYTTFCTQHKDGVSLPSADEMRKLVAPYSKRYVSATGRNIGILLVELNKQPEGISFGDLSRKAKDYGTTHSSMQQFLSQASRKSLYTPLLKYDKQQKPGSEKTINCLQLTEPARTALKSGDWGSLLSKPA
ncbi:MAG: hypothetical protein Q7K43_03545, partial [Candidatus Woesearchaeota archaeon]|nr:hypothetical protein [Candidatus Woesearchaeota archaeon]